MIRRRIHSAAAMAARAGTVLAVLAGGAPASGEPVYKDRERFQGSDLPGRPGHASREVRRPARVVTPGPGYAGSDWGLGKPSYWGIGPRPDWGWRSD